MRRRPVCARVALIAALAAASCAPAAEYLGSITWKPGWHGAGGYSGLWIAPDGRTFTALSDRGGWFTGNLTRDGTGAVATIETTGRGTLPTERDARGARLRNDAEALTMTGGAYVVAYEGDHRINRFDRLDGPPTPLPPLPATAGFRGNTGFEALTADAGGRLFAIPEFVRPKGVPVYVFADGVWSQPFHLTGETGGYRVTDADFGPDGRLYVLERDFALVGFRSRIRSFAPDGSDGRLEMQSRLFAHDNLEGLSIWRDAAGALRATMVSDDNFRSVQRTEFVDYALTPPPAPSGSTDGS